MRKHWLVAVALFLSFGGCSACEDIAKTIRGGGPQEPAATGPVFSQQDALVASVGRVNYNVPVEPGDSLIVDLRSTAFDPFLELAVPGHGSLTNDDYQGDRARSELSVHVTEAGTMKVSVSSSQPNAEGPFSLTIHRAGHEAVAALPQLPRLQLGQPYEGALEDGDTELPDGRFQDLLLVPGDASGPRQLQLTAMDTQVPNAILLDDHGRSINAAANGSYPVNGAALHRLQILSASPGQHARYRVVLTAAEGAPVTPSLARSHHQLPTVTTGPLLTVGQPHTASLTTHALPTGEPADVYLFNGTAQQEVTFELRSEAFDPYLMLIGPNGQHWENDDVGGNTNSALTIALPVTGAYRVVATAYRAGPVGEYELKVSAGTRVSNQGDAAVAGAPERTIEGTLAEGDRTISSGEFIDTHTMSFAVGQNVRLDARSTAFDTYLIVHPPTGDQLDNDDAAQGNTDAGLSFVAQAGEYRVQVTSYQPGETGDYRLVVGGGSAAGNTTPTGPSPTPSGNGQQVAVAGDSTNGNLAEGDRTIQSGEFADYYSRTFTAGQSVQVRLSSTAFDPYLLVRAPSGQQYDNDDLNNTTRNAGIDIPSTEAGEHSIIVTSYEAGETGAYQLSFGAGQVIAGGGTQNAGGGNVYGIFAGISDYPGTGSDLPECANDAIKLAESLRNGGLLQESNQIILTDAQATTQNLRNAMRTMAQRMGPQDIFFFFYSGHGGQRDGSSDQREIDGKDEYLVMYDGPLLDDEMGQLFDPINARVALFAVDACHAGGFAKDVITRPGRVGMFSSEEDVLSSVASQFQAGGYLSHFLRTAVSGEADQSPRDSVLTVGELTHFLYRQFGQQAADVQLQGAFQHLVVDRGAVGVGEVLWRY